MRNVIRNDSQLTICIHVDDVLSTSSLQSNLDWFRDCMKQEFKEIKVQSGDDMMYLGMRVQRNMDGSIILSMDRLLDEVLEGITLSASSPALFCLFDNDH